MRRDLAAAGRDSAARNGGYAITGLLVLSVLCGVFWVAAYVALARWFGWGG
ncbi:hypothetical protein P7B02_17020 [Caulobacter segnis]|uniref:hypothetical protein n=1 Tax=Caulobacter segnis TaxID=88688 RepID=UPI0024104FC6|nr:hypothetical protein [Caulobacter segnis]MDG2523234.1 hypothetical protein [Caulobacter segnis]